MSDSARDPEASDAVARLASGDVAAVRSALRDGEGDAFFDALLAALEGADPPALPAEVRDEALQTLIADEVAHDELRNARAGAVLADAGRFDLLVCLLGRADPHRMLLDAFEQVVKKPPVDPYVTEVAAATLSATRPHDLVKAAVLLQKVRGQHAQFLAAARAANAGLLPSIQADIKTTFSG